jgi:peroxiredoxin (alkyl hydroperoxide reductase subunit C)
MCIEDNCNPQEAHLPLIGEAAPSFTAMTTQGVINFPADYKGKWVVFFSHPADFTPVCTTEFMTFASMQEEFKALNAELVGLSVDSNTSHIAWLRTIKEKIEFKGKKSIEVKFPVVSDLSTEVARKYGMLQPSASTTQTVRAVFVIDSNGIIRAILYYPLSNGRNMEEIKRLLIALQATDEYQIATPANWQEGEEVIIPPPNSMEEAQKRVENASKERYNCQDWFLSFKKLPKSK